MAETEGIERSWLYNHIGRLAGIVLGAFFLGFLGLLAAAGYTPAGSLLASFVIFFAIIAIGIRMRGGAH